jgi:hypothetical protein
LFSLRRGVQQGDPLSCLLYNFSIELLSMRLCNTQQGVSVRGLPPAKLMMYADDTNLFVDDQEDLTLIKWTLDSTADTLGSSFNNEKTINKPFGDAEFMMAAFQDRTPNMRVFPHTTILPPGNPICILGVWVGSLDRAQIRWSHINANVSKLIVQWKAISASIQNRVLLAKALMQSCCYYLLDRNSTPPKRLLKISQWIQRFIWGPNSCMPYSSLASPVQLGRVDCPPLTLRAEGWNLKFLGDLLSGNWNTLWKLWTLKDIELASQPSQTDKKVYTNPFLQHSYMCFSKLEPQVLAAIKTARKYRLFLQSTNPPHEASRNMPVFHHPAIQISTFKGMECLQCEHGIWDVADIPNDLKNLLPECKACSKWIPLLISRLSLSGWLPKPQKAPKHNNEAVIWPTGSSPYNLMCFFTNPRNVLIRTALMDKSSVLLPPFPSHIFVTKPDLTYVFLLFLLCLSVPILPSFVVT